MPPRKRVYSGIQPTAVMTIGNYFGAVQNWVRLQDECDCVYCVVDLHAMTGSYDPEGLRRASREMFVSLLAAGIDPERTTVYIQSTVPEQTELCWMLATLTSLGDLSRMTQFKEKSGLLKGELAEDSGTFVSAGLLFYPVLQAADILAYRSDCVPVGQDQSQHLELSRGIARRFNSRFGYLFPEPETLHTPVTKVLSTADPTRKMSKSLGPRHYIGLFEEEDSIRKKIRSAVTDSGMPAAGGAAGGSGEHGGDRQASPGIENLLTMLTACGHANEAEQMRADYFAGTLRYVDLKGRTADALVALTTEMRERRADILRRETDLDGRIMQMAGKARAMAGETLALAREKLGVFQPQGAVP
ncbi:MAG: tryptophan--tRNA ligase [Gemmatimonadetes bacterium]|nr:tryptophan--tRNA ligase [Gemmatimonadota bacterium]